MLVGFGSCYSCILLQCGKPSWHCCGPQEAVKHTEYDRLRGSNNRGPGLMGLWPEKAVTFVDNHDTGSTQKHWPWPSQHVLLGEEADRTATRG